MFSKAMPMKESWSNLHQKMLVLKATVQLFEKAIEVEKSDDTDYWFRRQQEYCGGIGLVLD